LLDEVSYLSSKMAEYEELLESLPRVRKEAKLIKDQNNALLLMLGEKEEVLESTLQDMKDMKELYKSEIRNLLNVSDEEVNAMSTEVVATS
jgi:lipoate synthase